MGVLCFDCVVFGEVLEIMFFDCLVVVVLVFEEVGLMMCIEWFVFFLFFVVNWVGFWDEFCIGEVKSFVLKYFLGFIYFL